MKYKTSKKPIQKLETPIHDAVDLMLDGNTILDLDYKTSEAIRQRVYNTLGKGCCTRYRQTNGLYSISMSKDFRL